MLEFSLYHKILRISGVVLALVLLFQGGLVSNTTALMSLQTQSYLANSIGVFAAVEPTELNTITAGLTAKELALDKREASLREREINVGIDTSGQATKDKTTFILGLTLFIVLLLTVLNYVLDYLRYHDAQYQFSQRGNNTVN